MKKRLIGWTTAAVLLTAAAVGAQEKPAGGADGKKPAAEPPKAEQSVTQHSISIGGKPISYNATAGTLLVRNEKDEPTAAMGYVAYIQRDSGEAGRRPITFAYNGGPGSSSLWLHMGALGPRRIVTSDAGPTPPPPYKVVDNAYSIIDKTDLVMIDPVGTGLSHAVGEAKDKDFWGVDPDIESVSRFIAQYINDNNRWNSPKYLLGESYGTTRSAGIVDYLQTNDHMAFNGVILVSVALDLEAIFPVPGNDKSFPLFLPTYAATAWYHHLLPQQPAKLEPFLDEVRKFALGDYAAALMKGNALTDAESDAIAEKIHQYTGLSADFVKKAKLRIRESQFTQELMRNNHVTVGRLDSRFTGTSFDLLGQDSDYDPQSAAIAAPFTAAFLDYLHSDLKFGHGKTYNVENDQIGGSWDFKHRAPGAPFPLPFPNTGLDLGHALGFNPNLQILVLNGYYDLATPFLGTEYMMNHLDIERAQQSHIQMKYFEAGHMMYIHEPSLKLFKSAIASFYDATSSHP